MATERTYDIAGIDLSDDHYTVTQSLVRNKYEATDASGNTVLRGKQKLFRMREEFPFTDADGNDVFTVKATASSTSRATTCSRTARRARASWSSTTTSLSSGTRGRCATRTPCQPSPR